MLIVDGHNLIGHTPGLSLQREEEAREAVLRRIAAAKGAGGERVVVVFDGNRPGSPKESRFGGVRVVFSPAGRTADDEMLRRVRGSNPRAATVVTSDRALASRAHGLGAKVETCESFWQRISRSKTRPRTGEKPEPDPGDVEAWLRVFTARKERSSHKM